MQQKTSTQQGASPATSQPSAWQGYLSKLIALVTLLGGLGVSQQAWGQSPSFYDESVTFTAQPTGATSQSVSYAGQYLTGDTPYSTYTYLGTTSTSGRSNPSLGTYDINGNSALTFNSASLVGDVPYSKSGKPIGSISATRLQYRVYSSTATTLPNYTSLTLTTNSSYSSPNGNDSDGSPVYNGSTTVDLLSGLLGGGTYIFEAYYEADYVNSSGSKTIYKDPGSTYQATFTVTAPTVTPSGGTTTWQSTSSTDWSIASNWSNGVPTATANAVIPAQTAPTATIVYPILNDPGYDYAVRNLTLQGTTSSTSSALTINAATLTIYGNLSQGSGGLTGNTVGSPGMTDPQNNSTIVFAGADQVITGNLVVSDIIIAGSGTKSVINQLTPSNILAFKPASVSTGVIIQSASQDLSNGTVQTSFNTTGTSYIQLGSSAIISLASGEAETTTSYVKGVLRADRTLTAGIFNSFGNIGLDVTPNHNPGSIYIYRVVGDALSSPQNNSPAKPIKRQYQIVGDDDSGSSGTSGSTVNVIFHYLPSIDELNGIDENNLTMFRTTTKGRVYDATNGDLNTALHTFTRNNLPTLTNYTLTLGDKTNPLPVSLVAFGAVRSGANALLTWTTASEERNSGFNVQVSQDGVSFHTLSFVASQSPNSSTTLNYQYTDTEAGKTGSRYYRLEQVDESGTKNYSPVRVLNFNGAAATGTGALVAYPNPFTDGVSLTLDGASAPDGTAYVKLVDMTGRTVRESKLALVGSSLTLGDMGTLRSGLYLATVTLPDGTTQTVRISKQ